MLTSRTSFDHVTFERHCEHTETSLEWKFIRKYCTALTDPLGFPMSLVIQRGAAMGSRGIRDSNYHPMHLVVDPSASR